jgi:hypothetical protein
MIALVLAQLNYHGTGTTATITDSSTTNLGIVLLKHMQ